MDLIQEFITQLQMQAYFFDTKEGSKKKKKNPALDKLASLTWAQ